MGKNQSDFQSQMGLEVITLQVGFKELKNTPANEFEFHFQFAFLLHLGTLFIITILVN